MAIITTIGGASANSYVTLVEATAYFTARPSAAKWAALASVTGAQESALLWAAARLDEEKWRGARVDDDQALAWPRRYVVKPDSPAAACYETGEIPKRVKDAQCELALIVVESGIDNAAVAVAGFESFSDGVVSWTRDKAAQSLAGSSARSTIRRLLGPLLARPEAYR